MKAFIEFESKTQCTLCQDAERQLRELLEGFFEKIPEADRGHARSTLLLLTVANAMEHEAGGNVMNLLQGVANLAGLYLQIVNEPQVPMAKPAAA